MDCRKEVKDDALVGNGGIGVIVVEFVRACASIDPERYLPGGRAEGTTTERLEPCGDLPLMFGADSELLTSPSRRTSGVSNLGFGTSLLPSSSSVLPS